MSLLKKQKNMTDPSKRPLTFPKWHIPYLEKHKIQELFHEIARELVIQEPEDHLLFMKQILQNAAASSDYYRLLLIGSAKVNRVSVANEIAKTTQQLVITLDDVKNMFALTRKFDAATMARALACLVKSQNLAKTGWIIADCINCEDEAKELIRLGVLPTHVILLISPFQPKLNEPLYCDVPEDWPRLRRNLFGLREVFAKKIREISLTDKDMAAVATDCLQICTKRDAVKGIKPRVVILGPRGSGRKSQGRLLSRMMGLIHVDFEYILCQAWMAENELGKLLRQCNKQVCFHSELLCQIVNKRILEKDCLENGWVLTGYPYTVTDFQFLDSLETPPNRVIILDCDLNVAKERIRYREINAYTGSSTYLEPTRKNSEEEQERDKDDNGETGAPPTITGRKILRKHPKDTLEMIQAEHDFYCENYGSIKKYCGDTLMVVNGDQHERWVYECILGYLVGGNPVGKPRKGFGTEIPEVCSCDCIKVPPKIAKTYVLSI